MSAIECLTLGGDIKLVDKTALILRPAAYAIIVHQGDILLLKMRHTGKYHLPGGGVELGETIATTLQREISEETGIAVEVGELLHFEEFFFYYDPSDTAYHGLFFYYICRPKTRDLLRDEQVDDKSAEKPRWVNLADLQADEFQSHGDKILELSRQAI